MGLEGSDCAQNPTVMPLRTNFACRGFVVLEDVLDSVWLRSLETSVAELSFAKADA
ncbi:MAG: hypothetical protein ACFB0D_21250 [Phormidesmis sp.]